jgi:hypothetical protein
MSTHRFRTSNDLTQDLFRTWQICRGNFNASNLYKTQKMFPLLIKAKQAITAIQEQRYQLVCINDNVNIRNYERVMSSIQQSFESILPEKSEFEL